ncbi:MAG: HAMP domain-containing histidine kinase [Kiritimatiellae bacterium]|nr:HAMP domain-containing histidine kinase [Kiritimatiellia bacterium]
MPGPSSDTSRQRAEWPHDLRDSLTMARGFLCVLGRPLNGQGVVSETREPEINENLRAVEQSLPSCTEKTGSLNLRAPKKCKVRERLSLTQILQELSEVVSSWAKYKGVDVWVVLEPKDVHVQGDRLELARALQNLLINAVDAYMGRAGEVTIHLKRDQELAVVRVMDSGRGMDAEVPPRALEPSFTCGNAEGSGLGMGIVQRIVREHGGCLEWTHRTGFGTTVTLRLPICSG